MFFQPCIAALLLVSHAASPSLAPDVRSLVEAERAFAHMAQEQGSPAAFRAFIAEDGRMFLPDPVRAKSLLDAGKIDLPPIRWWPVFAGVSASGELGFTTGPAIVSEGAKTSYGFFFTIWERQPDGQWRWILDKGSPQRTAPAQEPGPQVEALRVPRAARGRAGAWEEVRAAETELARTLAADARAGLVKVLAPEARVLRAGRPPAIGVSAAAAILAEGPARIDAAPLGGKASVSGDLAYTYGTAIWTDASGVRKGHYVRVWQRRSEGWKLVADVTNAPAARPGADKP